MEKSFHVNMMVAVMAQSDGRLGIGCADGSMPFELPADKKFFKATTTNAPEGKRNIVVEGRLTFLSVPEKYRFFSDRFLLVLGDYEKAGLAEPQGGTYRFVKDTSLAEALETVTFNMEEVHEYFLCGGERVYQEGFAFVDTLYVTEVQEVLGYMDVEGNETFLVYKTPSKTCTTFFPNDFKEQIVSERFKRTGEKVRVEEKDPDKPWSLGQDTAGKKRLLQYRVREFHIVVE